MVGHGGSSVGSYLTDPTSPISSHCASIVATSTVRVKNAFTTQYLQANIDCDMSQKIFLPPKVELLHVGQTHTKPMSRDEQ